MAVINTGANLRRPVFRDLSMCALLFLASRAEVMGMHPFGIAMFSACFDKSISYIGIIIICAGLITSSASALIMKYIAATLAVWLFVYFYKKNSVNVISAACALSTAAGGIICALCYPNTSYDMLLSLIEGVISGIMYIVFIRAGEFMKNRSSRTSIGREELISVALSAGVCITGLSGVMLPFGITISGAAAVYAVMCAAYHCSLAAAGSAGLGIGFMCSMSSPWAVATTGFYGICALFGSLLKGFGKFGAAIGFLGGAAAALIYSKFGSELNINPLDIVIGSVLFIATPEKLHCKINSFFTKTMRAEALNTGERIRLYLCGRLHSIADSFNLLETGFYELSERRLQQYTFDAADLLEETARHVCRGCTMASTCWENDFNFAYKRMLTLLDTLEKDGEINEIPKKFRDNCIHHERFVIELTHVYRQFRERELFKGEALRARDLTSSQYKDISSMIDSVAASLEGGVRFCEDYEEALITELDKCGIILFEISVIEIGEGRIEVYLGLSSGAYVNKLEDIIKRVTGINVEFESESSGIVKFVTKPGCAVRTGLCAVPCDGCTISGDNAEIFDTTDCRSFVILSDGMGSGREARKESEGIVRLLRGFVSAGFDADTAIKTINSALCLQLDRERAATIDMLCIDRANNIAKFYKTGCAEAIIKHGDKLETVFPLSLPAGMVEDIDLHPQTVRIHSGDIIVMATDGVTQSGGIFCEWAKKELDTDESPEETARRIIAKATEKWGGAAFDDMTCVVIKID